MFGANVARPRSIVAISLLLAIAGARPAHADGEDPPTVEAPVGNAPTPGSGSGSGSAEHANVLARPPAPPEDAASPITGSSSSQAQRAAPALYSKPVSAGVVGAVYGAVGVWAYFAWFYNRPPKPFSIDYSLFELEEYAGGADKLGHFWATYVLARSTTSVLVRGGWRRFPSSLVASGLSLLFFTLSEVEDSFVYSFEVGDATFNLAGAAFSVLMDNVPEVDRLLDFRVEYVPSPLYRRSFRKEGNLDLANDYTGQSYMLALHLDALPRVTEPTWMHWARYVDVVVGFETRHFSPIGDGGIPRQDLYAGVAINMQHVLRRLFPCNTTGRQVGEGALEVLSVPYTTLKIDVASRQRDAAIPPP